MGAMKHWLLVACLSLLASSCGGDDDDGSPEGEECFQAGGLDDCTCSSNQPMGLRRCQDNLVWSQCECGEPFEEPCERGDVVECMCPGDDRVHTTECLGSGTYDCDCGESGGASGNGDD